MNKRSTAILAAATIVVSGVAAAAPAQAATASVSYAAHVQNTGWMSSVSDGATAGQPGSGMRLEALKLSMSGIKMAGHVQGIGWQPTVTAPATVGTTGKGLRLEAVRLSSTISGYAVKCQAYVKNYGWMAAVGDGEVCGTTGQGLRMEAVRISLVSKGGSTTPATNYAPGTTISPSVSQQVIVSTSTSTVSGTTVWYEWNGSSWIKQGTAGATYGTTLKPASQRVEGDGSTPIGTFGFVTEFGTSNINSKMPYKVVDKCAYWDMDESSSTYNRYYNDCKGAHSNGSVWLMKYVNNVDKQYEHAAATDFNYTNPIRPPAKGSGSGIMLHYQPAGRHTGGCIGVTDRTALLNILKWMDSSKNPKIVVKKA